jgi:hypothetical protein
MATKKAAKSGVGALDFLIQVKGQTKAANDLLDVGQRARQMAPLDSQVRRIFFAAERGRFEGQGVRWPALADTTVERKAAEGLDSRILRATGALYASLTRPGEASVDTPIKDLGFRYGTSLWYGRFADKGTPKASGDHEPKRKLLGFTRGQRVEINQLIAGFIAQGKTHR